MAQPEWFFDDALSRVRWEWAASMRRPEHGGDREPQDGAARAARSGPRTRTSPLRFWDSRDVR